MHFQCGSCNRSFPAGFRARDNHCRSTGHSWPLFECDTCAFCFRNEAARFNHMQIANHFKFECQFCNLTWPSQSDCHQHERDSHHYCLECDRMFMNANNLKQGMSCPFCQGSFTTATGLTHHLERGSCPRATNLNRETIFRALRSRDTGGVLTNNLLEWHGDAQYSVTDRAYNYNRQAWECYLCHRLFNSSGGLNQHLNSPAHQSNLYHCPKQSCGKQFKNLAAVINHLESESCGYTRFANVQQVVPGVLSGHRMIGF